MDRKGAEAQRENILSKEIIGAAVEVHRGLGPGLLESAYEECLCQELGQREINFFRQIDVPAVYKEVKLGCGYRVDIFVENLLIIELKAADRLLPVHEAQLLT